VKSDRSRALTEADVLSMTPALLAARDAFVGWQVRARRSAVRHDGGRPGAAMKPSVATREEAELSLSIVTVLVECDPAHTTDRLRQIYRRTHDPAERRAAALELMAGEFFQEPSRFSDTLTALFLPGSSLAERLSAEDICQFAYDDGATRFFLTCHAEALARTHPFYQATWYHNAMFNSSLPAEASVLAFRPDWTRSGPEQRQVRPSTE
jgi:hypothetical protein